MASFKSPTIRAAVDASTAGRAFVESAPRSMSPEEIAEATDYIVEHADVSSYHLLLMIRSQARDAYDGIPADTKVQILCSALVSVTYLNDWGHLGPEAYNGPAAEALVELGRTVITPLSAVLANRAPAPHFGSKDATAATMLKYRRCDYAYRYMMLVLGRKPVFDPDPKARDQAIAELLLTFSSERDPD